MRETRPRAVLLVLLALPCAVAVAVAADYVGAEKCKICHRTEYASWQGLPHAKTFDRLEGEERADPECLACHATGGRADLPGVQCEACHGAGSEYKSMRIMQDREAALAAGLIRPDEKVCRTCHETTPHDLPPFDYANIEGKGLHAVPEKPSR
jgi:RecJ-like exonuclease